MNNTNPFYSKYLRICRQTVRPASRFLCAVCSLLFLYGCLAAVSKPFVAREQKAPEDGKSVTEPDALTQVKDVLEQGLRKEIDGAAVGLQMTGEGIVLVYSADLLFDAGKSKLRPEAYEILDTAGNVLRENAAESKIRVEVHTDNEPVQASGWKSNWELSAARALSVVHYLQDEKGIPGWRLSACAYGEYRPVADNAAREGRQSNRRVEILVMPPPTPKAQEIQLPQAGI